ESERTAQRRARARGPGAGGEQPAAEVAAPTEHDGSREENDGEAEREGERGAVVGVEGFGRLRPADRGRPREALDAHVTGRARRTRPRARAPPCSTRPGRARSAVP